MVERASWATMDGESGRIVDVEDARLALGALWTPGASGASARPGIRPAGGNPGQVTASSPTPDTSVHVRAFQGILGASRGLGPYTTTLDADKQLDVLVANPADPSNPRNDLVVEIQSDTFYNDPSTAYEVKLIVGDPAASPIDPTAKIASPDYRILARVRVAAGATAIADAVIDNFPHDWTVALGGVLPVLDQAARDAIGNPYGGFTIWRVDRAWQEVYDGSAWRVQGVAICTSVGDRDAAITSPRSGQLCQTTDNDILWQYDGATSSWVQVAATSAPRGWVNGATPSNNNPGIVGETVVDTLTFNAVAGRRYKLEWHGEWQSTVAGDQVFFRIRWATGSTLDLSKGNTQVLQSPDQTEVALSRERLSLSQTVTGIPAGTATIGLTVVRAAGTGTIAVPGAADTQRTIQLYDVGAA